MDTSASLRVNDQRIAHDTIDGEVIIVNFENGQYFSLQHSAAMVWHWLVDGHSVPDILDYVRANCGDANSAEVESFVRQLVAEGLLEAGESESRERGKLGGINPQTRFAPPELTKYDDMQELILLDPIHEVDATGWPNKAA